MASGLEPPDRVDAVIAAGKLQKAEELAAAGKPLTHHMAEIQQAGTAALKAWAERQRQQREQQNAPAATKPATPEAAEASKRIRKARERERQRDRGMEVVTVSPIS